MSITTPISGNLVKFNFRNSRFHHLPEPEIIAATELQDLLFSCKIDGASESSLKNAFKLTCYLLWINPQERFKLVTQIHDNKFEQAITTLHELYKSSTRS